MKVCITGANGQLGSELIRSCPPGVTLSGSDLPELDVSDRERVLNWIGLESPDLIINAAAFTHVDRAESNRDQAFAVNRDGAANLASAAARCGARMIHISTDFVFEGNLARAYTPADRPNPVNVYGESKLAGEDAVRSLLPANKAWVVRTSWLYSSFASNFPKTILELAKKQDPLRVVSDQVGVPTWGKNLSGAIWDLTEITPQGLLHWCDSGIASWYDFAVAVVEEAFAKKLLRKLPEVEPISSSEYPTPARRPSFSILDSQQTFRLLGYKAPHWRTSLRSMLDEIRQQ